MAKFESTGATQALMTGLALAFVCSGVLSSVVWNAWFGSLGVMEKAPFRDGRTHGAFHDPKPYTPRCAFLPSDQSTGTNGGFAAPLTP